MRRIFVQSYILVIVYFVGFCILFISCNLLVVIIFYYLFYTHLEFLFTCMREKKRFFECLWNVSIKFLTFEYNGIILLIMGTIFDNFHFLLSQCFFSLLRNTLFLTWNVNRLKISFWDCFMANEEKNI